MKNIKETCTKGTNIYLGNEKREYINKCVQILLEEGFTEIQIPILQEYSYFQNKVGEENNNMMYRFSDKGGRNLCLAPEYTSIIINLKDTFKNKKDVKLFYVQECFRGEKPQAGRYRQFTQLGIEIVNPDGNYDEVLIDLSSRLLSLVNKDFKVFPGVKRGLDYYKKGKGFEIRLGDSQIVGGGEYENGIGFAIGIDRLLNITKE